MTARSSFGTVCQWYHTASNSERRQQTALANCGRKRRPRTTDSKLRLLKAVANSATAAATTEKARSEARAVAP